MKKNIIRISILPLVLLVAVSFTGLQPQKEKVNTKETSNSKGTGNQDSRGQGNKGGNAEKAGKGNRNDDAGRVDNGQGKNNQDRAKGNQDNRNDKNDKGNDQRNGRDDARENGRDNAKENGRNDDKDLSKNDKSREDHGNGKGKSRKEAIKWDRDDDIDWGFENGSSRKRPGDQKKVTVCHNTGDSNYPVTISVSENALKAHLNHGDQAGNCTTNYSDRWPANFIKTRENVYNTYQNTWENISYSEALLRFAADKLLGIKSTFQAQRPTLTSEEIQRRESLISELQNNVNSLRNQLDVTRQRTEGISININL